MATSLRWVDVYRGTSNVLNKCKDHCQKGDTTRSCLDAMGVAIGRTTSCHVATLLPVQDSGYGFDLELYVILLT